LAAFGHKARGKPRRRGLLRSIRLLLPLKLFTGEKNKHESVYGL
jgi:hypothetical protein